MDFVGWAFSDLTTTGPDPFASNASANASSVGASTITINSNTAATILTVTDGDSEFTDGDSDQRYQGPADFNGGANYDVGDRIETEYSYVIRAQGSSDPADNITIYMLEIDARGEGIASDARLEPGVTYDIIAVDSSNPVVGYSNLFICFDTGTQIATPQGPRVVEELREGDLVETLDNGPQPLRWIGRRTLHFPGSPDRQKPILVKAGALGVGVPERDLVVSPQHRFLLSGSASYGQSRPEGSLVKAKHLLACPGVRQMAGRRAVTYHSLLFDRHEIIHAEGAPVESYFPASYGLSILTTQQRAQIYALCPSLMACPDTGYGSTVRPVAARHLASSILQSLRQPSFG